MTPLPGAAQACRAALTGAVCCLALATLAGPCAADPALVKAGRHLYREGRLPTGEYLDAHVQGDIPVNGAQLTCVNCHRRSGLGSSEGSNQASPVTGRILYQPREYERRELAKTSGNDVLLRPAYTDASLCRAIRSGIDANERPLDALMPRYRLDEAQCKALVAYLKSLGDTSPPGVDEHLLHLSTILTPGTGQAGRDTLLQVLQTFFADYNARTRNEPGRAAHAPWYLDWKFEAYREIRLHVWELEGPPASWQAQLEQRYAARPVFAVVGGLGGSEWQPVHDFCEAQELPCLFPNTALPASAPDDFYSLYFNEGMALEGRVAASFLLQRGVEAGSGAAAHR